jgi:putative ABC transport system ATP-binding protein
MEPVLEGRGLEKVFELGGRGTAPALAGVDVALAPAEFVAVMGPSGSGKSTLLHLLGGLERPSSGEVWLRGRRIDGLGEGARAVLRRRELGFVFQFFNLIGNLTAAQNVELAALVAGQTAGEARRRREALFARLGLEAQGRSMPSELSGGEQQRVALARALVNEPTVLLADEPTGNLDSASAQEVLRLLRQAREGGQTILLVTHDARVAAAADRVITLRDGRIADETPLESRGEARGVLSSLLELEA